MVKMSSVHLPWGIVELYFRLLLPAPEVAALQQQQKKPQAGELQG